MAPYSENRGNSRKIVPAGGRVGVRQIFVFDDISSLEEAAARESVRTVRNAVSRRGVCHVALAGGSTPRGVYARLSE